MLRNALAAALRHLYRGKLHAAIAVFGLAIGLCGALLSGLYIRSQYSFDHFIPGYQDVYLTTLSIEFAGRPSYEIPETPAQMAGLMRARFPEISSITRLAQQRVWVRAGAVEQRSSLYSVDPGFFDTLPLATVAGDLAAALSQPDRLVLTREQARIYFGDDAALGRALEVQLEDGSRHAVTVGAVLEEFPRQRSQLQSRLFISGLTAWTRLAGMDRRTGQIRGLSSEVRTLVRLHPGASPANMEATLTPMLRDFVRAAGAKEEDVDGPGMGLVRIDRARTDPDMNPGFATRMWMALVLGGVILAIACVNFVNLLTARAGSRAVEVGVRKLAGASRPTLALQFLGEALAMVVIGMLLGMAMTELLLPWANAFLEADASFQYWKDPLALGVLVLAALLLGLLSGFWPALVLSALRPVGAMHGGRLARGSGGWLRQALVTLQFALLTGLIVAAGVVYLQHQFAMQSALRFVSGQVLVTEMGCTPARLDGLRRLPGVRDASCSDSTVLGDGFGSTSTKTRTGEPINIAMSWVDDRTLTLYGIPLLAGRMLEPADFDIAADRDSTNYLINETAMRRLGFDSPQAALGEYPLVNGLQRIVGVVRDFSMGPVDWRIEPTVFYADPGNFGRISVQLDGSDVPATLAAIDRLWTDTGGNARLERFFLEERVQQRYQDLLREAQAFGFIAVAAVLLACLGLLGLAAAVAEQRTKEIGLRKALGATTGDVLRLLLWQFSKPVLWANLVAWPVAGWAMQRWLEGFAYHVELPLWLFPAAALATLLIALATVSAHAAQVSRAKPVSALRHE